MTNALREQNVQVAAGSVGAQPSSPDQMYQLSVRAAGRLVEVSQFGDIVVKAGKDGALVRVKDVGRVELGAEDYSSRLRFAGVEASGIGIQLLPSANALATFSGVLAEMERLERTFPPGLEWRLAFDNVVVVRESIIEVLITLAEAIGLVILVMFLFLQNWRSTLIPAVTIPVSLIGTFAFIKVLGFSINTLTLFGIVLATGIVVDDAIVVIENIERHMRESGKTAAEAATDAMREVFSAVVVIGIVLVSVFVPVAFFPGTTGRMYQQFSMTIAFAVVLSVFNAVTFTPALAALLLREGKSRARQVFLGREPCHRRRDERVRSNRARGAAVEVGDAGGVRRRAGRHLADLPRGARRVCSDRGRGLLHHDRPGPLRRIARVHQQHHEAGRSHLREAAGDRGGLFRGGLQLLRRRVERRLDVRPAERIRGARGCRAFARRGPRSSSRADVRHSRERSSSRLLRPRFRGSRRLAGSSSKSSI